jgi:hypothetical protein
MSRSSDRAAESRRLSAKKNTHRPLAWGVLGLATDGLLFSLLTLLFSGVLTVQTRPKKESFAPYKNNFPASNAFEEKA